ncbi:MAG: thiamine-phosphate kinase [Oscillatoriaceae bacterium SKW80]|nr:thiamine-phosphate kinase [Oscillatoriaceae bacterium SKYG93]MCX8121596.1 thiamine-phosphate kinase [Oscillatoriaceae bacterium SKW80]MDW8452817.1 thiamine-phosphate kinase [Oscillatoriaceae cyanobacterium SKYGB_i_bin93]
MTDISLSLKVCDIKEQGLLERLQSFCAQEIVGDDAAVMQIEPGKSLVITTDVLVDGVHFSEGTTSPEDAGWRAAAANLSDLAAMGAEPLAITVGLGIRGDTLVSWVERLYQGMTSCLKQYNTLIVGGDIVRSPVNTLSITAFGQVNSKRIIRRSAAQPGDAIVVTGVHGASRAGLELLLHPELAQNLNPDARDALILAHQRPRPRLDVLPFLWSSLEDSPRVAGMDSSDGLADAVVQICQASGVGARIERDRIPIPKQLSEIVSAEQALNWALYGGEDFELVLCLPPVAAEIFVQKLDVGAAIVGAIAADKDILLVDKNKKYPDEPLMRSRGFQHF